MFIAISGQICLLCVLFCLFSPQDPRPVLLTPLWSHFYRLQLSAKTCLFSHKALWITFVKTYRVLERTCWQYFLDLFCKIISDFSRLIICIVDLLVSLFWGLEVILDFELCIYWSICHYEGVFIYIVTIYLWSKQL